MIPKEKELKLIKIYMYDEELLTVYLFCGVYQHYFNIKDIYTSTKEYFKYFKTTS